MDDRSLVSAADAMSPVTQAAPSGETLTCPQCENVNGAQTHYCGQCGVRLWEPCPSCGQRTAVNRRFCGGCGVSISESLKATCEQAESALDACDALAERGYFADAIVRLEELSLGEHTQVAELSDRVRRKAAELADRRQAAVETMDGLLAEAKQRAAEGDNRTALQLALRTPEGLRNTELKELVKTLEQRVRQADQIRAHLKESIRREQYEGLLEAAEKLLELEPQDPKVVDLATRLRQKQQRLNEVIGVQKLKAAIDALKNCDYGRAQRLLEQIPDVEFNAEIQQKLDGAQERAWLARMIALTHVAGEGFLKAAERFARLQAHDPKAKELYANVTRAVKQAVKADPGQPVRWRPPSSKAVVVCEVARAPKPLGEYCAEHNLPASQLGIAYGLALDGVGAARYPADLRPRKQGWLAGRGRRTRGAGRLAWGIDFGASALKAVLLERDAEQRLRVMDAACVPYQREGEDRRKAELPFGTPPHIHAALDRFFSEHEAATAPIVVGVPGPWTLARGFRLPVIEPAKLDEAVTYEARMRIPLPPDDLLVDHFSHELQEQDDLPQRWVTLIACSKSHYETLRTRFDGRKIKGVRVSSACTAQLNWLAAIEQPSDAGAVALVDVGAKTTGVTIVHDHGCWMRGLYHGADGYDHLLVKGKTLGWDAAEGMRRQPWKSTWMHEIDAQLAPGMDELISVIGRSFGQFTQEQHCPISKVLLGGGASSQLGLLSRFTAAFSE